MKLSADTLFNINQPQQCVVGDPRRHQYTLWTLRAREDVMGGMVQADGQRSVTLCVALRCNIPSAGEKYYSLWWISPTCSGLDNWAPDISFISSCVLEISTHSTWMITETTACVFVLGCWYLPLKQIAPVEFTSAVNIIFLQMWKKEKKKHFCQEVCNISKETAGGGLWYIPVTRSLSGPITACSPSAANSMLSLWELMRRFRACPWASFGPAVTKNNNGNNTSGDLANITPEYYICQNQISSLPVTLFKPAACRECDETHSCFDVLKNVSLLAVFQNLRGPNLKQVDERVWYLTHLSTYGCESACNPL